AAPKFLCRTSPSSIRLPFAAHFPRGNRSLAMDSRCSFGRDLPRKFHRAGFGTRVALRTTRRRNPRNPRGNGPRGKERDAFAPELATTRNEDATMNVETPVKPSTREVKGTAPKPLPAPNSDFYQLDDT